MKKLLFIIFIAYIQWACATEQAVMAVVNQTAITDLDFKRRLELIIKSNNLPRNAGSLEPVKVQILQMLIDEKLFEQEAQRLNISIDEIDIKRALYGIAESNNLNPMQLDTYFKKSGISREELENQVKHQLLWSKLIKTQVEPFISVTEQDVRHFQSSGSQTTINYDDKVKLAEIVLFSNKGDVEAAKTLLDQLGRQIASGRDFKEIARNFSQGGSAKNGGEIGWFYVKQLSQEFAEAISDLKPGDVSQPIIMSDSVYVIKVLDRVRAKRSNEPSSASNVIKAEELKESVKQKKLDIAVKGYLLKLRKQAFINVK